MAENFQYVYVDPGDPSPVVTLNLGASLARGHLLGFMIDGARMLSPGVLNYAVRSARAYAHPVVSTPGYHLGREAQQVAVAKGYDQAAEDRLLASVGLAKGWLRAFRISSPAVSMANGWLAPFAESNVCLSHQRYSTPLEVFTAVSIRPVVDMRISTSTARSVNIRTPSWSSS